MMSAVAANRRAHAAFSTRAHAPTPPTPDAPAATANSDSNILSTIFSQTAAAPGHSPCKWTNSSLGITPVSDCAAASGSDDRGIRRAALACQPSPPRVELLRGPPSWVPPRRRCRLRRLPLPLPSPRLLRKVRLRLPLPRLRPPRSPAHHRALRHRTPPHRLLPPPLRTHCR